jgi:serine/threonine-protein kinase
MNIAKHFGRYEIRSELGRGSMATVYHASDPKSGREVALKVLPREMMHDLQFRARFENEIKLVAGLEHSSIVPVYDVGEEKGQPYFVMRYMPGGSLAQRIAKGKLSLAETARIIEKVASALAYAHKKGVIHRDLKPDNILFDNDNEPFISDFGIAKLFSGGTGSLTGKEYVGTPAYMSPEQAQGEKMDGRSDVYSLGAVVYQMLTGEPPYQAENPLGLAIRHVTQPVPEILKVLSSLPNEVDIIIKTAMAKNKTQRYDTPIDLARALNFAAFGNAGNLSATNTGLWNRLKTGLIFTGIIFTIVVVGFFLLRDQLFASAPPAPAASPATSTPLATHTALPSSTPKKAFTSTPAPTDMETLPPSATVPPFAPDCPAGIIPPTPDVNWLDSFCVQKSPYTTVSIPAGATFEVLKPDFSCKAEVTRKGKTTLSCLGIPSYSFDLKVCNPPAVADPADSGKCPQGLIYDAANRCCSAPQADTGCAIYTVDIRSCP